MKKLLLSTFLFVVLLLTACSQNNNEVDKTTHTESTAVATTSKIEEDIKLTDEDIDDISNAIKNKFKDTEHVSVFYNAIYKNYKIAIVYECKFATSADRYEYAEYLIEYCKEIQSRYKLMNVPTIMIQLSTIDSDYNKNHKEISWITSDYGKSGILSYKSDNVELSEIEAPLSLLEERLKVTDYI